MYHFYLLFDWVRILNSYPFSIFYKGIPESTEVDVSMAQPPVDSVVATGPPVSGGPNSSPLNLFPQVLFCFINKLADITNPKKKKNRNSKLSQFASPLNKNYAFQYLFFFHVSYCLLKSPQETISGAGSLGFLRNNQQVSLFRFIISFSFIESIVYSS